MHFGRPAVLSSESIVTYDAIVARFLECIKPRDFIEKMFVNDVIDFTWDVIRYTRHKMLTMERQFRRRLEYQANQAKLQVQRKEALAQRAQTANAPTTVLDRKIELEQVVFDLPNNVAAILKRTPNELDHARGLEDSIEYHERLDRLQGIAVARRNDALQQISLYRQGLGSAWSPSPIIERDEHDALSEALPDLDRLIRYERRAWSRRKRTVREFIAIKARAA
jgi:hypothetical protein